MTVDLPKDPEQARDAPEIELTDYERELVRAVGFGIKVEEFIHGDVGTYIFGLAGEMESQCDQELRLIDPTDLKGICDLQVRARAASFLKNWLQQAVQAGIDAQREAEQPPE